MLIGTYRQRLGLGDISVSEDLALTTEPRSEAEEEDTLGFLKLGRWKVRTLGLAGQPTQTIL